MPLWSSPSDEKNIAESAARELICEIGRRCHALNFCAANGGNISYRLAPDRILCTPTLISKGYMTPDDLVVVDAGGAHIEGRRKRSSEILLHLYCYERRPDIKAVVHMHPRNANVFALTHTPLPTGVLPEVEVIIGQIPLAAYGDQGTPRLPATIEPFVAGHNVILLSNHGALAMGPTLMDAFWRMEVLDAYCDVILKARTLGELQPIGEENLRHLAAIRKSL
ncbi:MAG: class II aldolase/adducin family protein [Candidatus Sumerlaeota bacterium]|nr:class II aldolase/adducin family protein [Candidatus Sumerlaeota bacterium]